MDGAANMALDHALMSRARATGEAVLRVYTWSRPVLSLGRNQRAVGIYDDAALADRAIEVVRRPTGGRALLHLREVTYSVTAPATSGLTETYRRINALLVDALARLGVLAEPAVPATRSPIPSGLPCFAEPSAGEIVVGAKKLVGSAQWRDDGALLQHGSIILHDDQSVIPSLMREPTVSPSPAALADLLGRTPSVDEVAEALFAAVRSSEDSTTSILEESEIARLDVARCLTTYSDPLWTWRR
jgi:lipoate-protein ligase A